MSHHRAKHSQHFSYHAYRVYDFTDKKIGMVIATSEFAAIQTAELDYGEHNVHRLELVKPGDKDHPSTKR